MYFSNDLSNSKGKNKKIMQSMPNEPKEKNESQTTESDVAMCDEGEKTEFGRYTTMWVKMSSS